MSAPSQRRLAPPPAVAALAAGGSDPGIETRHRLNRGGDRQLNAAIHQVAVTQLRAHPPARVLMDRRIAAGNSKSEALRLLKRHLADVLYAAMCVDEHASSNTATARQPAAA